jgi:hypothetical protein
MSCHIVARQHPRFVDAHSVRLIKWQITQPVSGGAVFRKLAIEQCTLCIGASPMHLPSQPPSNTIKYTDVRWQHAQYVCGVSHSEAAAHACELVLLHHQIL